ncbi:MAG: hypothetical protein Q4G23_00090 [Clostridia bacterium]|nr:hypothetical protein [Clostridia bacterium]
MNGTKSSNNINNLAIIIGLVFVAYNAVVFALCGFADHNASFWISIVFANVSLISVTVCAFLLKGKKLEPRDWMMGYPFYRHGIIYVITELVLSVIFMVTDKQGLPWSIAFVVQFIVMIVFGIIIITCFMAKDTIEEVREKVKVNTAFMKMLLVDADMLVEQTEAPELKKVFSELRDQIRYSDPVSNEQLADLEGRLASQVDTIKVNMTCGNTEGALDSCKQAMLLLSERNRKCKLLK